jgi:hypothetical protein
MSKRTEILLAAALAIATIAGGWGLVSSFSEDGPAAERATAAVRPGRRPDSSVRAVPVRESGAKGAKVGDELSEERRFAELLKSLRDEIEAVFDFDANDRRSAAKAASELSRRLSALVAKRGYAAVPADLRAKMVETLGLLAPYTLPEALDHANDPDPEIADAAFGILTDTLNDTTLGDAETAPIIKALAKRVTDEDIIDSMLMTVETEMRRSVAVDTYCSILESGTDEIRAKALESIADFTEEEDVTTVEKLHEWLDNHPDDEDDADFYKGVED